MTLSDNLDSVARYAVFGDPIKHSKSPQIHQLFAEQTRQCIDYQAQQVSAAHFTQAVETFFAQGGQGLNCTVPLKTLAWERAEVLTQRAQQAQAVNTLKRLADGRLLGDNTDGIGLIRDLTVNHALNLMGARLLILGAGGACRGIIGPLLMQNPACLMIANRTLEKAQALVAAFQDSRVSAHSLATLAGQQFDLILNATSASLSDTLPEMPPAVLMPQGCCYDLAYSNSDTPFVAWGKAHQASKSIDGLGMLVEQAAEAFYLWRGIYPQTRPVILWLQAQLRQQTPLL